MEHYIVSARKYRPSTFASVVGQKPLAAALKHAIATDKLAHAYLFCGSRGVGKTSCARIFAKTINCEHRTEQGEACNECESCKAFNAGTSLNIIELDAASHNGIDDMKALIEQVQMPPVDGRYRVFIIDEVHMLSSAAFNAFLKTLEEPPQYVIFILATTEKHKIIPTILSRCQIYDFNRITIADMISHLSMVAEQEGIQTEVPALGVIARKADGAMRDALSIFDQVAAASMGNITYQSAIENLNILDSAYYGRVVEAMLTGNVPVALVIYKEVRDKGFDSQFFINGLGLYLRDLMLAMHPATINLLETDEEEKAQMEQTARKCPPQLLYRAMDLCNDADLNYRAVTNKQFLIELTLVKLCQLCSPSPGNSGDREGQLKPIAATPSAAPAPAPAAKTAPAGVPAQPMATAVSVAAPSTGNAAPTAAHPAPAGVGHQPSVPLTGQKPMAPQSATPHIKRPSISLSIRGKGNVAAPQVAEEAPAPYNNGPKQAQPYSQEALLSAWTAFADARPTERILVNTMIACKPVQVDGDRYFVPVDDAIQVDKINEFKHEILLHLRKSLQNDNIDFDARIAQRGASPVTWTNREVLQHMVDEHPSIADMINDFGFTIA